MKGKMKFVILTDNKVGKILNGWEVMYTHSLWKNFSQGLLGQQGRFQNASIALVMRMARYIYTLIPTFGNSTVVMTLNKPYVFSLFPSMFRIAAWSKVSFFTASTLAISIRDFHLYLQNKRLISRLMRAVAIKPLPPLLSALFFRNKKTTSRISFDYTLMRNGCQAKC
jgi:hypothetical protein